ncbi:hypothetical protein DFH11DRAFT_6207 [Phellopilus nigrolimitatus]|nr:hypothetical protein DFH11DRAFT_6207 [Phellopilus nigrolimitatus]
MSSTNRILDGNALYIGLFYRPSNLQNTGLFHWTLLAKTYDKPTGILLHAAGTTRQGWVYDVKDPFTFESSRYAVVAIRIGSLGSSISSEYLARILGRIPIGYSMYETPPVWTCRIWVRDAIRYLHGLQIIHSLDVDALEREAIAAGTVYRDGVGGGWGSWGSKVSTNSS